MTDPKQDPPSIETAPAQVSYEPPQLVFLGNLRDLVGKSGEDPDGAPGETKA